MASHLAWKRYREYIVADRLCLKSADCAWTGVVTLVRRAHGPRHTGSQPKARWNRPRHSELATRRGVGRVERAPRRHCRALVEVAVASLFRARIETTV